MLREGVTWSTIHYKCSNYSSVLWLTGICTGAQSSTVADCEVKMCVCQATVWILCIKLFPLSAHDSQRTSIETLCTSLKDSPNQTEKLQTLCRCQRPSEDITLYLMMFSWGCALLVCIMVHVRALARNTMNHRFMTGHPFMSAVSQQLFLLLLLHNVSIKVFEPICDLSIAALAHLWNFVERTKKKHDCQTSITDHASKKNRFSKTILSHFQSNKFTNM